MTFAPVGIKCPDHAGVGAAKRRPASPQRTARQAQHTIAGLEAPATVGLVALNVLVYLITVYQGTGVSAPGGRLFDQGALVGAAVRVDGDWYRLVTAMFLHGSLLHLAFNMLALYWLGTIVEQALGTWRFLLLYFVSGIAGSAGALLLSNEFAVTVGASGAIFGIMGAWLVLEYMATGTFAGQALGLIVLNLALTFAIPNISVGGHLGGLVGGILATFALAHFRYARPRSLGPVLVGLIMVASFLVAYVRVESYVLPVG
jgi:membrane associated rhomboid family serine protease